MSNKDKPLILVVDDEEIVRAALELILRSEGYRTICAVDGVEAIEILRKQTVDLVITDVRLPRAGGLAVLQAAKLKNPAPKVIMITGFTSEDPLRAFDAGADEFIYKVFKREEILEAIHRLLAGKDGTPQEK